jgi:hypothetical protein
VRRGLGRCAGRFRFRFDRRFRLRCRCTLDRFRNDRGRRGCSDDRLTTSDGLILRNDRRREVDLAEIDAGELLLIGDGPEGLRRFARLLRGRFGDRSVDRRAAGSGGVAADRLIEDDARSRARRIDHMLDRGLDVVHRERSHDHLDAGIGLSEHITDDHDGEHDAFGPRGGRVRQPMLGCTDPDHHRVDADGS